MFGSTHLTRGDRAQELVELLVVADSELDIGGTRGVFLLSPWRCP